MTEHEIYENDDDTSLCLECSSPIETGEFYCDKCFDELEKAGYFALDDEYDC